MVPLVLAVLAAILCPLLWCWLFAFRVVDQGRKIQAWKVYRAEGHPIEYTLRRPWRIFWYARKYRKKNFEVCDELLGHFNAQRKLFSTIRRTPFVASPAEHSVRLAAVGDMMWVRTNWDSFLDPAVKAYLRDFDVLLGNLETPIDRSLPPVEWYKIDAARFNSDIRLLTAFHDESKNRNIFTAVSFANNHVFDKGDSGALDTIRVLEELGIQHSGLHATERESRPVIFERNGIRFGFYATCFGYNDPRYQSSLHLNVLPGLAPAPVAASVDTTALDSAVDEMEDAQVDFKILSVHWGHEFELYPTGAQTELGKIFAALGFDLIVGGHSHVVQPSEICFVNGYEEQLPSALAELVRTDPHLSRACIKGRGAPRKALIHYSLGNFITAMLFWEPKFGVIQSVEVFRCPNTQRVDWQLPKSEFVYNALSIHNRGRKELHLLKSYFQDNQARIDKSFPRNRAAASYLIRHLCDQMTQFDLQRGPHESDYRIVCERFEADQ